MNFDKLTIFVGCFSLVSGLGIGYYAFYSESQTIPVYHYINSTVYVNNDTALLQYDKCEEQRQIDYIKYNDSINIIEELYENKTNNINRWIDNVFSQEDLFRQVIYNVSVANDYVYDFYDCTQFSNDVSTQLNSLGFNAKRVQVVADCDSGILNKSSCERYHGRHDIVLVEEVYIEATTGKIINPKDYENYGIN